MKRIILIISVFVIAVFQLAIAQNESKDVTITASGSGQTSEAAKQSALRSATEQAFGVFISSKTEIFNDELVADEISSVSSGNIKSYETLNESQLPDSSWGVTIKAIVSVDKLTSFVQAKGISIEMKGGLFALNVKQQLLNEQGEIKAVAEMVGLLHEPMQTAFDYEIENGDPISLDSESKNWSIPLIVTATTNKNMEFCANYLIRTLKALSLTTGEVESYKTLNKPVYPVTVSYNGAESKFYLRKETSVNALNTLVQNWEFYTRLFTVDTGMEEYLFRKCTDEVLGRYTVETSTEEIIGSGKGEFHKFRGLQDDYDKRSNNITFPSNEKPAATFYMQDKRTLSQIEQISGYLVKPRGVVSPFKHGGFVVFEENGHGLIVAACDIGIMKWNDAKIACEDLLLNGYGDWRLPTHVELKLIHNNLNQVGIGGFCYCDYFIVNKEQGCHLDPRPSAYDGGPRDFVCKFRSGSQRVRPVRSF